MWKKFEQAIASELSAAQQAKPMSIAECVEFSRQKQSQGRQVAMHQRGNELWVVDQENGSEEVLGVVACQPYGQQFVGPWYGMVANSPSQQAAVRAALDRGDNVVVLPATDGRN